MTLQIKLMKIIKGKLNILLIFKISEFVHGFAQFYHFKGRVSEIQDVFFFEKYI